MITESLTEEEIQSVTCLEETSNSDSDSDNLRDVS